MDTKIRYTAKGKPIPSNYGITPVGPSTYRCQGCGKLFSAHDMNMGPHHWPSRDGERADNLNRARAMRHADICKGPGPS